MPKRRRPDNNDFVYFKKKLKKLEQQLNKSRKGKIRVIESSSSSSSSSSSRGASPDPHNTQDGDNRSGPSMTDLPTYNNEDDQDIIAPFIDEEPSNSTAANCQDESTSTVSAAATRTDTQDPATAPNDALDNIVLEILGDDPSATITYGPDIHKDLASRFEHIATNGLEPNQRKELLAKYQIPANCTHIAAPVLNAEIKAALPEPMLKKAKSFEIRQKQLAAAISSLGSIITDQLASTQINQDHVKKLMDTARLLCDIQSTDSKTRRNFAMFSVKKDMKEHLSNTKIDKFLFGENLSETVKTAKAVSKSGSDLKAQQKSFKKPAAPQNPKAQTGKNWKSPAPARRGPGPPRSREPAPRRAPPAHSSRQSPPPLKTTRRR